MRHFADIVIDDMESLFMDKLRRYLIGNGIWLGGNMAGCLSTATTQAHIDKFCQVLKEGIVAQK